jgi:hypothetical protein
MHAPITDISQLKRICFWLGAVGLVVACAMTFEFGKAMSYSHAIALCLLTIAVAVMWPYVDHLWHPGSKVPAFVVGTLALLFTVAEFGSHLGYTVGHRVRDTQETGVVNATYKQAQESLASEKQNLQLWRDQLAKLQEQYAWAPTVSADGLRAKLASHDKAIQLETARGGCKGKCLGLMKAKADTEEKIAIAEQASDLKKRIEATQRILDRKGETAKTTEFKTSKIVNQTNFAAQLWTANIEPDAEAREWTQIGIGFIISLVTTFLPACMWFIAFRDAAHTSDKGTVSRERAPVASGNISAPTPTTSVPPVPPSQSYQQQLEALVAAMRQPALSLTSTSASLRDLARAQGLVSA